MAPSTTQRLASVGQQIKALQAEKRRLQNLATQDKRKATARREGIAGKFVLADEQLCAIVLPLLAEQLKKTDERALFDLPPLVG
jgi:hypothetical protein